MCAHCYFVYLTVYSYSSNKAAGFLQCVWSRYLCVLYIHVLSNYVFTGHWDSSWIYGSHNLRSVGGHYHWLHLWLVITLLILLVGPVLMATFTIQTKLVVSTGRTGKKAYEKCGNVSI